MNNPRYRTAWQRAIFTGIATTLAWCCSPMTDIAVAESSTNCGNIRADRPVVLLVHGLNNTTAIMKPWADSLEKADYSTVLVSLRGHQKTERLSEATSADWIDDIAQAYNHSLQCAPNQSIYAIGYSLGGLAIVSFLNDSPAAHFDGLVLLAPALRLTTRAQLLKLLAPLNVLKLELPSLTPEYLQAHSTMPLTAYSELHSLVRKVRFVQRKDLMNLPTLILISSRDELVSRSRLATWIDENNLEQWKISDFEPQFTAQSPYRHLIADSRSLTEADWSKALQEILQFLKSHQSVKPSVGDTGGCDERHSRKDLPAIECSAPRHTSR